MILFIFSAFLMTGAFTAVKSFAETSSEYGDLDGAALTSVSMIPNAAPVLSDPYSDNPEPDQDDGLDAAGNLSRKFQREATLSESRKEVTDLFTSFVLAYSVGQEDSLRQQPANLKVGLSFDHLAHDMLRLHASPRAPPALS